MNKLAYDNLKLLNEVYSDSLYLISDHNILSLIEKDNYDTCSNIKSLEYPIYFTYHHILNIVDYDKDISYKNKMNLLTMIDNSLNNLINYLDDYTEDKENIYHLVDDIYERLDTVKTNQKHNYLERFIYLFDEIVDGFREAEKYLYFSSPISFYPLMDIRPGEFLEDEGETDEGETENESDEEEPEDKSDEEEPEDKSETEGDTDKDNNENDTSSEENINENNHMEVKLD